MTSHLDADLVAAYLDGGLPENERELLEAHLYECDGCCEELAFLDDTLRTTPKAHSLRRRLAPLAAAAAILAAVLVARPWLESPETPAGVPDVIERAPDLESTRLEALSPDPGAVVEPASATLEWRSGGDGARYQITVTTLEGDSVWVATTADTIAPLPPGSLQPEHEYLWYVDAILRDGRTASTGVSHFRTAR
jgi:anti-sigma factor RsiW